MSCWCFRWDAYIEGKSNPLLLHCGVWISISHKLRILLKVMNFVFRLAILCMCSTLLPTNRSVFSMSDVLYILKKTEEKMRVYKIKLMCTSFIFLFQGLRIRIPWIYTADYRNVDSETIRLNKWKRRCYRTRDLIVCICNSVMKFQNWSCS